MFMGDNTLISVIIPVYNMERYISECIDSVLMQNLGNIELICINDESSDNSLQILEGYRERDERIVILNQQNSGSGIARNNGIKAAKGKYVAFMDPDDWYPDENVLKVLYEKAEKNKALICGGSLEGYINGKRSILFDNSDSFSFKEEGLIFYKNYQFDHGYTRFIFDRKFLIENDIFFPDYRRYQDPPFFVKAMTLAKEFYAITTVTYCYRMEHKKLIFDERKSNDFLKGIRDVLSISASNGLDKLFCTTLERLEKSLVSSVFINLKIENTEMLKILLDIDKIINEYTQKSSLAMEIIFECFNKGYKKKKFCLRMHAALELLKNNPVKFFKLLLKI